MVFHDEKDREIARLMRIIRDQEKTILKLLALSTTDELTQIKNRRGVLEALDQEIARAERFDESFSILMIDIDHFKKVNDSLGHEGGDIVLKSVATTLSGRLRHEIDHFGRFGGEEFFIILPKTPLDSAMKVAEDVRKEIEKNAVAINGSSIKVTVSIGVSQYDPTLTTGENLKRADKALYESKAGGRNRITKAGGQ